MVKKYWSKQLERARSARALKHNIALKRAKVEARAQSRPYFFSSFCAFTLRLVHYTMRLMRLVLQNILDNSNSVFFIREKSGQSPDFDFLKRNKSGLFHFENLQYRLFAWKLTLVALYNYRNCIWKTSSTILSELNPLTQSCLSDCHWKNKWKEIHLINYFSTIMSLYDPK